MIQFDPTERIGIHQVALTFLQKFGWIEREQPISDFGIDMHVEIVEDGVPTGQVFALQIKSGPSYFSEQHENSIVYRGQKKHLDYWLSQSLPVLIVLHNPDDYNSYWEFVESSKITELDRGWKIEIPKSNLLSESIARINKFYSNPNHYTVTSLNDDSHSGARRISAKILVESTQARSRFSMKNMIPSIIEKLKHSDYYKNDRSKDTHRDKPADVVFIFFYDGIQQVDRGLTFCRAIWNSTECSFPLKPFKPDEIVDDIEIIWDKDYSALSDFIPSNEMPKGLYLEVADRAFNESRQLFNTLDGKFQQYEKMRNYIRFKEEVLFLGSELDNLSNSQLNMGFPPLECQHVDSLISGIIIFLHNILIIARDKERSESNVVYLIRDYLNGVREKLPFYEYERKKVV